MSLQVVYGNYFHASDEAAVAINRSTALDQTGQGLTYRDTWVITGEMIADTPTALAARCLLLEAGYSRHYRDAAIIDSSGNVLHLLQNSGSFTGVRVIQPPSYPRADGPELATQRTFQITLEAEYQFAIGDAYLAYQETVQSGGGGPLLTVVQTITGPPRRQKLADQTPFTAMQSGSATGRLAYPPIPGPLWPGALMKAPVITRTGPSRQGQGLIGWSVSWQYEFAAAGPLLGLPTTWPT